MDEVLTFLRSTDECINAEEIRQIALYLEDFLCAFRDGIDVPESSCAFQNHSRIGDIIEGCIGWWYSPSGDPARDVCPPKLSNTGLECSVALEQVSEELGCCLINIISDEKLIANATG